MAKQGICFIGGKRSETLGSIAFLMGVAIHATRITDRKYYEAAVPAFSVADKENWMRDFSGTSEAELTKGDYSVAAGLTKIFGGNDICGAGLKCRNGIEIFQFPQQAGIELFNLLLDQSQVLSGFIDDPCFWVMSDDFIQ